MREQFSKPCSPTELKFRTRVKTYFTTLEEDETIHWMDKVIMVLFGVVVLWVVLLGLGVMF